MADVVIQSTGETVQSEDSWWPVVVPFLQPWPDRLPAAIQRLTVGNYAINQGHFMHDIPVMQFVVTMLGVVNRPLAGSWEALEPKEWSLWDPVAASPVWPALEPSPAVLISQDEAIAEIIPDARGDVTSKRRYNAMLTNEGASFVADTWQAEMGWAVIAFRLLPDSQAGPVLRFATATGYVEVRSDNRGFTAYIDDVEFGTAPKPVANDHVIIVGVLVANTEARVVIRYGGTIHTLMRPHIPEPGVFTLQVMFGGNSSPEMLVYALAHGYEWQGELAPNLSRFTQAINQIAGFLAC